MIKIDITTQGGCDAADLQTIYSYLTDILICRTAHEDSELTIDGDKVLMTRHTRPGRVSVFESPSLTDHHLTPYAGVGARTIKLYDKAL